MPPDTALAMPAEALEDEIPHRRQHPVWLTVRDPLACCPWYEPVFPDLL